MKKKLIAEGKLGKHGKPNESTPTEWMRNVVLPDGGDTMVAGRAAAAAVPSEDAKAEEGKNEKKRSAVSFRRQGSSGLVWDDRFLSGELNQVKPLGDGVSDTLPDKKDDGDAPRKSTSSRTAAVPPPAIDTLQRSRSNGGGGARGYRAGKVSPSMEPPSPKVSACGFCGGFGKKSNEGHKKSKKQPAAPKRRSR